MDLGWVGRCGWVYKDQTQERRELQSREEEAGDREENEEESKSLETQERILAESSAGSLCSFRACGEAG